MKIVICTGVFPPSLGGPATYAEYLAKRLSSEKVKVVVITYGQKTTLANLTYTIVKIKFGFFLLNYWSYFKAVLKHAAGADTILILGTFSEGIPTIVANRWLHKKTVLRLGGFFAYERALEYNWTKNNLENFWQQRQNGLAEIFKKIESIVIGSVSQIIVNSQSFIPIIQTQITSKIPVVALPNLEETQTFSLVTTPPREYRLLPDKRKIILSVGRLVKWKNFDLLIKWQQNLPANYYLFIIGEGPNLIFLQKIIQRQHLTKKVLLLLPKKREELASYYRFANYFVLLSSYEGYSHVLSEAKYFRLPIVALDIPQNREILSNYQAATLIPLRQSAYLKALQTITKSSSNIKDFITEPIENLYLKTKQIICS